MSFNRNAATRVHLTHYWNDIELVILIDFNVITTKEINEFVRNHFDRPLYNESSEDSIIEAFLKIVANACLKVSISEELTLDGLLDHFNRSVERRVKLLPALDGSDGILIEKFSFSALDDCLFEITR